MIPLHALLLPTPAHIIWGWPKQALFVPCCTAPCLSPLAAQVTPHLTTHPFASQLDQANVYAQYRPAKCREGHDHPDPIVESQVGCVVIASAEQAQRSFDGGGGVETSSFSTAEGVLACPFNHKAACPFNHKAACPFNHKASDRAVGLLAHTQSMLVCVLQRVYDPHTSTPSPPTHTPPFPRYRALRAWSLLSAPSSTTCRRRWPRASCPMRSWRRCSTR